MTHADALYRSILANPDDDLPRLVYADWLEENGKADTAAFIRTQIELARVSKWDPLWVKCRYWDRSWLTGKGHNPPGVSLVGVSYSDPKLHRKYHRGFPTRVAALNFGWWAKEFRKLLARTPLDGLELNDKQNDLPRVCARPEVRQLRSLRLSLIRLDTDERQALAESPHLNGVVDLQLEYGSGTADVISAVCTAPLGARLREMRLTCNSFNDDESVHDGLIRGLAGQSLPELERLDLHNNPIDIREILDSTQLPRLTRLGLRECGLADSAGELGRWSGCRRITDLDLGSNRVGLKGVRGLAAGPWNSLRVLRLESNPLTPAAMNALAEAEWLKGLRVLDLFNTRITPAGLRALVTSPGVRNLICLNLDLCKVGNSGAKALLDSPHLGSPLCLNIHPHSVRTDLQAELRLRFGPAAFLNLS